MSAFVVSTDFRFARRGCGLSSLPRRTYRVSQRRQRTCKDITSVAAQKRATRTDGMRAMWTLERHSNTRAAGRRNVLPSLSRRPCISPARICWSDSGTTMNFCFDMRGQKEFITDKPRLPSFSFKKLLFVGCICTIGAYLVSETVFPLSIMSLTICTVIVFLKSARI
jgi:hypothetical protein